MTNNIERDSLARAISASVGGWNQATQAIQNTADAVLAWMRENGYEKRATCPQPCEHLSAEDSREGRTCAEHPCICDEREPADFCDQCSGPYSEDSWPGSEYGGHWDTCPNRVTRPTPDGQEKNQ